MVLTVKFKRKSSCEGLNAVLRSVYHIQVKRVTDESTTLCYYKHATRRPVPKASSK